MTLLRPLLCSPRQGRPSWERPEQKQGAEARGCSCDGQAELSTWLPGTTRWDTPPTLPALTQRPHPSPAGPGSLRSRFVLPGGLEQGPSAPGAWEPYACQRRAPVEASAPLPLRPRRACDPAARSCCIGNIPRISAPPGGHTWEPGLGGAAKGWCPAPNSEPTRGPGNPQQGVKRTGQTRGPRRSGRGTASRRARAVPCPQGVPRQAARVAGLWIKRRGTGTGTFTWREGRVIPQGTPHPAPGSPGQPAKFRTEEVVSTWDQERLRRGDIPQGTTQATWPRRSCEVEGAFQFLRAPVAPRREQRL